VNLKGPPCQLARPCRAAHEVASLRIALEYNITLNARRPALHTATAATATLTGHLPEIERIAVAPRCPALAGRDEAAIKRFYLSISSPGRRAHVEQMDTTDAVLSIRPSGSIWWATWRDAGAVVGFLLYAASGKMRVARRTRFTCWMP
jgi:hypothetical protein